MTHDNYLKAYSIKHVRILRGGPVVIFAVTLSTETLIHEGLPSKYSPQLSLLSQSANLHIGCFYIKALADLNALCSCWS